MNSLLQVGTDYEKLFEARANATAKMLEREFSQLEKCVSEGLNSSAKRISDAISAHEKGMTEAMRSNRLNVLRMVGRTWLTLTMVSVLLIATSGSILWWQGQQIVDNYMAIRVQKDALAKMNERTWGVSYQESSDGRRFLIMPKGTQPEVIPYKGTNWIRLKQE